MRGVESPYDISYSGSLPDAIHDFAIPDLPTPGTAGDLIDDTTNRQISLEIEAFWQKHQLPNADSTHSFGSGLTEMEDMVFDNPGSLTATTKSVDTPIRSTACACQQQAMSTNEAIEVIMWGQKETSSDVYDILQQQKAALAKCEDLLGCQGCCIQSPHIMLLLSMCRRLLVTFEKISQGPTEEEDRSNPAGSERSGESRKRKSSSYESSGVEGRRGYGISIRERRLDDDDEFLVLQSLVSIRVKMLNRILGRLDQVVSQYNWPVHKGVCRDLQTALNAGSFT